MGSHLPDFALAKGAGLRLWRLAVSKKGLRILGYYFLAVGTFGTVTTILVDWWANGGLVLWAFVPALWSFYLTTFGLAPYLAMWKIPVLTAWLMSEGSELSFYAAVNFFLMVTSAYYLKGRLTALRVGFAAVAFAEAGLWYFGNGWWYAWVSDFQTGTPFTWFTNADLFAVSLGASVLLWFLPRYRWHRSRADNQPGCRGGLEAIQG